MFFDAVSSEEETELLTGTSGIPSRFPPLSLSSPACADRCPNQLRRVAPSLAFTDASYCSLRLTWGFQDVGQASGCPSALPTRVAPSGACPGDRLQALASRAVSGLGARFQVRLKPPSWFAVLACAHPARPTSSLPSELPRSGRAKAGPVGHLARWPLPGPSWPRDPPDLHGHPTG